MGIRRGPGPRGPGLAASLVTLSALALILLAGAALLVAEAVLSS